MILQREVLFDTDDPATLAPKWNIWSCNASKFLIRYFDLALQYNVFQCKICNKFFGRCRIICFILVQALQDHLYQKGTRVAGSLVSVWYKRCRITSYPPIKFTVVTGLLYDSSSMSHTDYDIGSMYNEFSHMIFSLGPIQSRDARSKQLILKKGRYVAVAIIFTWLDQADTSRKTSKNDFKINQPIGIN